MRLNKVDILIEKNKKLQELIHLLSIIVGLAVAIILLGGYVVWSLLVG